jgi:hypothetical protein
MPALGRSGLRSVIASPVSGSNGKETCWWIIFHKLGMGDRAELVL